jgi:hypothetical protein
MESAKEKVVFYEQFLQELSCEVDASLSRRINEVLKVRLDLFALQGIRYHDQR